MKFENQYLFIYGTLVHKFKKMKGVELIGNVETIDKFKMYKVEGMFNYPALVKDSNGTTKKGLLFSVPFKYLEGIDNYEGTPDLFRRTELKIKNFTLRVQTYIYCESTKLLSEIDYWTEIK